MASLPTEEPTEKSPVRAAPSLLKAAGLIAAVTILSKLLGAVRDWAIMNVYGASLATDAYFAAFQLPSFAIILLGGLGGPFHTATVAVFSRLIKDGEAPSEHARRLASTFLTVTGIFFTGLSVLCYVFAEPIMATILWGGRPELIQEAARQLQVMSPVILAGGVVGIFYGLLNIYHSYVWPSLAPAAMSVTILFVLFALPADPTGIMLAWATLAGAMVEVGLQLPVFFKNKFNLKPALDLKLPELRQIREMLFPAAIGTTIGQLNSYIDMFFASRLEVGGWTAVVLSNRLIQLPLGVLQTALLVPIFPRFSRHAADNEPGEIKRLFKTGVVSLWFVSVPILVLMLLYTQPIIRLLFQHGSFDAEDTLLVSQALIFQAFQILPYFARDSITRVFYAYQDSRTPLMVGLAAIFFKGLFNWLLVGPFGVGGITFSTTLVTFINMLLLGILSKRHIADLGFREMLSPFTKLVLAGALMGGAILLTDWALSLAGPLQGFSPAVGEYAVIIAASLVGTGVYAVAAINLKIPEAQYLRDRLLARFKRA